MLGNVLSEDTAINFLHVLFLIQFFHREYKSLWWVRAPCWPSAQQEAGLHVPPLELGGLCGQGSNSARPSETAVSTFCLLDCLPWKLPTCGEGVQAPGPHCWLNSADSSSLQLGAGHLKWSPSPAQVPLTHLEAGKTSPHSLIKLRIHEQTLWLLLCEVTET